MPALTDLPSCSSRALVPVEREMRGVRLHRPTRRAANFLTHLIATAHHLPQTRERRRAEPSEVIAAYQASIARLRKTTVQ
jgi:hypothetical protein